VDKPPPQTERLVIMRGDLAKMDIHHILPDGKHAKRTADMQDFLDKSPEYKDSLSVEIFSFTAPKIDEENVSNDPVWRTKKDGTKNASRSKN
jgi:hypothetical protein